MADKLIVVAIDNETGDFTLDLQNFHGKGCGDVAKAFEKLGKVVVNETKPEYYEGGNQNQVSCGR